MARARGITQIYRPPTRLYTNGMNHPAFTSVSIHQMAPPEQGSAHPITAY